MKVNRQGVNPAPTTGKPESFVPPGQVETPRCRACGHIAHEQNECRVCAGCDDGRPMPGKADAPAIFLCQVCDQTPERGHAPDCPGARSTNPPDQQAETTCQGDCVIRTITCLPSCTGRVAETPPLLTPELETEICGRCGVRCVAGFCGACHLETPQYSPEEIAEDIAELAESAGTSNYRSAAMLDQLMNRVCAQAAALRTAEQERDALRQRDEYRRSNAGTCAICGTTIWGRDGLIQDERVMHPLCQLRQRAEVAEREAAALREERDARAVQRPTNTRLSTLLGYLDQLADNPFGKPWCAELRDEVDRLTTELAALRQRGQELEQTIRREWWLGHGCTVALYGDDGEMQCSYHGLDFLRLPLDRLEQRVNDIRRERLAKLLLPAVGKDTQ